MLFLGGGSCPSCGSQVATDVIVDDISIEDDTIPGLDDVVESLGSTQEDEDGEHLPFGMGAKAEMMESSLPFGVGSFADDAIEYQKSDIELDEEVTNTEEVVSNEEEIVQEEDTEVVVDVQPNVEFQEDEFLEEIMMTGANTSQQNTIEESPPRLEAAPVEEETATYVTPAKFDTDYDNPEVIVEYTDDTIQEDVPDMWKIDAAKVNFDDLYAQEEQIIEVSYDEDQLTSNVEVSFDDFHHLAEEESTAADNDAPQLHPAKAMAIETAGVPEIQGLVDEAFEMLANQSWLQAAQVFGTISANLTNTPSVLNNLGLSLLQAALEMDVQDDPMASSQYEAAIMALRQGAKIDSGNDTILVNLAHSLLVSGRAEKASGIIDVVRARVQGDVEVENLKAACLIQLEREEEARQILLPYAADSVVASNLALI